MKNSAFTFKILGLSIILSSSLALAGTWTYPGCKDVTDADFESIPLITRGLAPDKNLVEPDKMDFDMDAAGNVDIYFTEIRPGNIKRYNGATKTVKTLVKLPNWGLGSDYRSVPNSRHTEEGVTGIVLDPNFKTNHFIYVHWSPLPDTLDVFRISRFTVTGDTILMSSEKIILQFPAQREECCHTGGSMAFDDYGDLWIAQGANGGRGPAGQPNGIDEVVKYRSEEWGAASTQSLRGSILRIHPDNSAKGYSIPEGNFGAYFAKQTGDTKYLDVNKVAPEVYIKGIRNNYSLAVDPVRRWVAWGDVGPDIGVPADREEMNLRKTPGFEGWPYFVGKNKPFNGNKDAGLPKNNSKWNLGLVDLPPARPTTYLPNMGSSPITGPIYRYNGALNSSVKLPPHFNRKWFVTDFTTDGVKVLTLNDAGDSVIKSEVFPNTDVHGPVDFRVGPDGALYISNYGKVYFGGDDNTSIIRISYKGDCRPATPLLEKATVGNMDRNRSESIQNANQSLSAWTKFALRQNLYVPQGMKEIQLYDLSGKKVWENSHLQSGDFLQMPDRLSNGSYWVKWTK